MDDPGGTAQRPLGQRRPLQLRQRPRARRDGITVGIVLRVSEAGFQRVDLLIRYRMLLPIGSSVKLFERHTKLVGQIALQQPVGTNDPQRQPAARGRQA